MTGRPRRLGVIVEADGGARGNPGPAGYGALVREAATNEVLVERADAIGVATNNVAEYRGLIAGLQAAADVGAVEVEVRMDSKLVVEQMSGRWQIKHPGLRPLAAQAAALVRRFEVVRFTWIPRERNRRADALANAAMDGKSVTEVDLSGFDAAEPVGDAAAVVAAAPAGGRGSWTPPATGVATRLVLVRHGETDLTAQRRYSGRHDVPMSPVGKAQAEATAVRVAELTGKVAAVVSSPLSRCVATAEAIAHRLGPAAVQIEPDLIECDFGEWESLTFAEVRERWPDRLDQWLASPTVAAPGGESLAAVGQRVAALVPQLVERYSGSTVVVVSHVTPIKMILRDALGAGDPFLFRLFLDPAGISTVEYWPDGGIAVRTVNDTAHLA